MELWCFVISPDRLYRHRNYNAWRTIMAKKNHSNEPVVVERTFAAPVERVWKAISTKEDMKRWSFDIQQFKPEVGFEFAFTAGPKEGVQYLHKCKVTEVIPQKKLSYSWRFEGYAGDSLVTFELSAEGNKTRLRLTHTGLETFPPISDFARENFVLGWTSLIGKSLKGFVEGTSHAGASM